MAQEKTIKKSQTGMKFNDCPKVPDSEENLGFVKKSMVSWFNPVVLFKSAKVKFASNLFLSFGDRRAILAALQPQHVYCDWAKKDVLWIDYVADLGDGWNSTYAIARSLARKKLTPEGLKNSSALPRGDILVMGGDQVYPYADREHYRNRLVGPYRSALPCVPENEAPRLFAIPANHDWYGGLKNFTRLFCQGGWIGGWKTQQHQSYFAVQLPHGWWLWGIDTQLDAYIDLPQREYFKRLAESTVFKDGDRVILCLAEPGWIYAQEGDRELHRNVVHLEKEVIDKNGGKLVLTLTGDLHHYARYEEIIEGEEEGKNNDESNYGYKENRQKITCGGGGAFMHGTHHLPKELTLEECGKKINYNLIKEKTFPSAEKSCSLVWRNLKFPILNTGFAALLGVYYLAYSWILQALSYDQGRSMLARLADIPMSLGKLGEVVGIYLNQLFYSPSNIFLFLFLLASLIIFTKPSWRKHAKSRWGLRGLVGSVHALAHIFLMVVIMWIFARWNSTGFVGSNIPWRLISMFSIYMLVVGGLAGGFVFGIYLAITNRVLGFHRTEAFSSLRIPDYKTFLRMYINKEGLTIYPIGIEKTPQDWCFKKDAPPGRPWFEPVKDIETLLIEGPIMIRGKEKTKRTKEKKKRF